MTAAHQAPPSLGFSRQEDCSGLPFPSPMHESEKWKWSRSVMSDSSWPHELQPTRLLCPWDTLERWKSKEEFERLRDWSGLFIVLWRLRVLESRLSNGRLHPRIKSCPKSRPRPAHSKTASNHCILWNWIKVLLAVSSSLWHKQM